MDRVDFSRWSNKDFSTDYEGARECSIWNRVGEREGAQIALSGHRAEHELVMPDGGGVMSDKVETVPVTPVACAVTSDQMPAVTPMVISVKRELNLSPSTPVGLPRKLLFKSVENNINAITHQEDIEMADLECCQPRKDCDTEYTGNTGGVTNKETPGRRELKGLRRMRSLNLRALTVGEDLENDGSLTSFNSINIPTNSAGVICDAGEKVKATGSAQEETTAVNTARLKGISLKHLKHNLKVHELSSKKKLRENYKSTRKKNVKSQVDGNQRLIREFFTKTPTNQVLVGSSIQLDGSVMDGDSE